MRGRGLKLLLSINRWPRQLTSLLQLRKIGMQMKLSPTDLLMVSLPLPLLSQLLVPDSRLLKIGLLRQRQVTVLLSPPLWEKLLLLQPHLQPPGEDPPSGSDSHGLVMWPDSRKFCQLFSV